MSYVKKILLALLLMVPLRVTAPDVPVTFPVPQQFMTLSANGKYLVNSFTNKPVFINGEDGFALALQLSDADVETYLKDRANKGFNFVWVGLIDADQKNPAKNFAGNAPFDGPAFTHFNEAYWAHIDFVVQRAQALGITLGISPAFVGINGLFQTALNKSPDAVLTAYGRFLGERYKTYPNIVWVLGGDADPQMVKYKKINRIGEAIAETDENHLLTLEAIRFARKPDQSTLTAYGGKLPSFINLNWVYNKQATVVVGCEAAYTDSLRSLPPLMGEDWYELEHSVTGEQARQEGYWAVLSGCYLGRLSGNGPIWSFNSASGGFASGPSWKTQLDSVGSVGQQYLGKLMNSRQHWLMVPDTNHTVLTGGFASGEKLSVAARSADGQTIIAYFSEGNASVKTIDMTKIESSSSSVNAWWYDPRTGTAKSIGTFPNAGTRDFTCPDERDWVLVLDDASATLREPGLATTPDKFNVR